MDPLSSSSPVYFWRDAVPSTGYLSQWYQCAFTDDADPSIVYPSAEHYMMFHKALLFHDTATASKILSASHPREVKALGRLVANFSDTTWNQHREAIVRKGNLLKFTRPADVEDGRWMVRPNPQSAESEGGREGTVSISIREMLLRTGERELVEASPTDRIWGIGFTEAKAGGVGREKWGLNLLGKALMEVRDELRKSGREGQKQEEKRDEEGK